MVENPKCATVEFIDGLLDIVSRFRETLVSAKAFVEMNNDMEADGGDPFEPYGSPESKIEESEGKIDIPDVEPTLPGEWPKACREGLAEEIYKELDRREKASPEDRIYEKLGNREDVQVRSHGGRRARVTKETRERIIDALLNRVPKPRMVDVAEEFNVSQTTVSRVWGIYQADRENRRLVFDAPTPLTDVEFHPEGIKHVPLPGQLDLPIISEGRKPGPED